MIEISVNYDEQNKLNQNQSEVRKMMRTSLIMNIEINEEEQISVVMT